MATHKFDLKKEGMKRLCKGGSRYLMQGKNMALALLTLKKGGLREPHWHPNASELAYCVIGKALVTLFSPGNERSTFTLSAGDVAYFPKGYIHHIENLAMEESQFILAYDHGAPEDLDLSASLSAMSDHVLGVTFDVPEVVFKKLKRQDAFITERLAAAKSSSKNAPHKFSLERITAQIETEGGLARIMNGQNFPALQHLALFSLRIYKEGVREPHWHPNATELNYVVSGKARLIVFSPGGKKETFTLVPGQGSVIPAGYFHHIENIGTEELHMTVYFNHAFPEDIGLSGAISAYSNEVLASLFSVPSSFFAELPKFEKDRMIMRGG